MKATISHKVGTLAPALIHTGFLPSEGAARMIAGTAEWAPPAAAPAGKGAAKRIGLFLAAPFIGLAYILALPVVAIAMLAWVMGKALAASPTARRIGRFVRNAALFLASPFIGLAYLVALPFVGFAMITRIVARALAKKLPTAAKVARVAAAPFLGLALLIALPFAGLVMIARLAVKAALATPATA